MNGIHATVGSDKPSLVEQLVNIISAGKDAQNDPKKESAMAHASMRDAAHRLLLAIETPTETVRRLIYQPPQNAALKTVVDLKLFDYILEHHRVTGSVMTAKELAVRSGADTLLITRMMRVIVGLGLCDNPAPDTYTPNSKTAVMTEPIGRDGTKTLSDLSAPACAGLPDYLAEHSYCSPGDDPMTPMHAILGVPHFKWLAERPHRQHEFNSYMTARREGAKHWTEIYPVQERLLKGSVIGPCEASLASNRKGDVDNALLVDIAGGRGHDLATFRRKFPNAQGSLVLMEQQEVLDDAVDEEGVKFEKLPFDFNKSQPVEGARAYFLRSVLHDWENATCRTILSNTKTAMKAGYSKLLINDFVLPDALSASSGSSVAHEPTSSKRTQPGRNGGNNATNDADLGLLASSALFPASLDIQMMALNQGIERTERQWRDLLGSAGLEVMGIWGGGRDEVGSVASVMGECVIEAMVAGKGDAEIKRGLDGDGASGDEEMGVKRRAREQ
ncbi:MAG: hypothetical protein M1831_007340 [Alyxoria varia]|nr:MAG: hypothetical protein M1831_007340 [Alyxoria varia]